MKIVVTFVNEYNDERTEEIKQMAKDKGVDFVDYLRMGATAFADDIQNEYECVEGETFIYNIDVVE